MHRKTAMARSRLVTVRNSQEEPLLPWSSVAFAFAFAVAVRRFALAKAMEDPEGGTHGCGPFFIGTGMSRMKNP
ncbi:hypothetical protein, partial [Lysobacter antibioticus]|uniref:hypothetical protein n=1 Tax=Lysobacter antibioticus TaxID=84531 RepID=UPI001F41BF12